MPFGEPRLDLDHPQLSFERTLWKDYPRIAGVDEAGRGPLAGPVVAAACILPKGLVFEGLTDSKQLSPLKRTLLYQQLTKDPRVLHGIGLVDVETIDRINILQAALLAMHEALENLPLPPDCILVDGKECPPQISLPCQSIIKGDRLSLSIAAASVLAKVYRDSWMEAQAKKYPQFSFARHKGYGTLQHLQELQKEIPCPLHRKSFEPVRRSLALHQREEGSSPILMQ